MMVRREAESKNYSLLWTTTYEPIIMILLIVLSSFCVIVTFSSSLPSRRHTTFKSLVKGQGQNSDTDIRQAMACARLCLASDDNSTCQGFTVGSGNSQCVLHANATTATESTGAVYLYQRAPGCPPSEQFVEVRYKESTHCIGLIEKPKLSHSDAWDYCGTMGASLLRLDSEDKYNVLILARDATGIRLGRFWIAITDAEVEGQWVHFPDGAPVDPTLLVWGNETRLNSVSRSAYCGAVYSSGKQKQIALSDRKCYQLRGFVCEAMPK